MKRLFIIFVAAVALGWAGSASATQVSDSFNRANAATLGSNWSNASGVSLPIQIVSNTAVNTSGTFSVEVWTANAFTSDQFSKATFSSIADSRINVMVRAAVATNDLYACGKNSNFDATHYVLYKTVAGAASQIGSTSAVIVTANDIVELDVVGTTLTCIVNGSTIFTQTDSSLTGNYPGIQFNDSATNGHINSWSGGDLPVPVLAPHTGGQLISAPMFPQATPSVVFPPDAGYTHTAVASGANLQTAITGAACGTKLLLAANGSFSTGSFYSLPNTACACHTDPSKWVIIQSDDPSYTNGSVRGTRIDPSVEYTKLAHIVSTDTNYVFVAADNGTGCYWFGPGLDLNENAGNYQALIYWGDSSSKNWAHDMVFDHSYGHGRASTPLIHCLVFNGAWEAAVDSYISDCHNVGQDTQAIVGWDGVGPALVQNNFLEGAAENILIGGADPQAGIIPSDFTFQRNHFFKPLSWRVADPSYAGIHWSVKNCFELKDAQRVLVTGNVFENGWGDGQSGQCITWNSSNQSGNDPQAVIADINMYLNVIRHFTQAYEIAGNTNPTYQSDHRISIHDNLSWDIDVCIWDNCHQTQIPDISLGGRNNGTLYATYDLSINHETIASRDGQNQGGAINFQPTDSTPYYGFNVTNSILNNGVFGAFFRTAGSGDAIMPSLTPGGHANNNCIYGSSASGYNNAIFNGKQLVTAGQSGVFVTPGVDFHVAPASVCHNAASDSTDMGANIDAVTAATAGVTEALANPHTVTNVSPSTFTHLGSTSITITGTNFISGAAEVIVGGAGPAVAVSTDICAVNTCTVVTSAPITLAVNDTVNMAGMVNGLFLNPNQGQFLVASVTDTTHFTYTDNGIGTQSWLGGAANRITPGNACASVVVVNSTTITCTTPAATGTVTNGSVSVFVSQFGIQAQFNGANYN